MPSSIRTNPALRFCLLFSLYLSLLYTVVFSYYFKDSIKAHLLDPLTETIAYVASQSLNFIGMETWVHSFNKNSIISEQFGVTIKHGCDGLFATMVIISTIMAFPMAWRHRISGAVLGIAVVQLVNLLRVDILFLMGYYFPLFFYDTHIIFGQVLVVVTTLAFWMFWVLRFKPAERI